jgi:ribosome-binding factor A
MDSKRSERVADRLLEEIAELLAREVNDPRIVPLTLTGVKVSKDLRHARVYFSPLEQGGNKSELLNGLRRATGYIRAKVAKRLNLRFVPEIEFLYDEAAANAERIEQLLREIKET